MGMGMQVKSNTTMRRTVAAKRSSSSASIWYGADRPKWLGPFSEGTVPSYLDGEYPVITVGILQVYQQTLNRSNATENLSLSTLDGQCWVHWDALHLSSYQNTVAYHSENLCGSKRDHKFSKMVVSP